MPNRNPRIAVFPGAFDPITNGHVDIIRRAAGLFDEVIIAVGHNPEKSELFTTRERVEMVSANVDDVDNVRVQSYDGLTIDFVRSVGAKVILRGIRDSVDLRSELQAANTNLIVGDVETVFLMATDQHALTSSSLIKQIVSLGGYEPQRLARLVPANVAEMLRERFKK
jgi:pantetheine-phosphate adenylyltransferase